MTAPSRTGSEAGSPDAGLRSADGSLAAYDALVDRSPQGILFCHSWWLDAVAPGRWRILSAGQGGDLRAAWPIVVREDASGTHVGMPNLTQKLGVLFAPSTSKYAERLSDEHQLTEQLMAQLPAGAAVDQQFHERFTNWLPFYWAGYQQSTRYTYVLDPLDDLAALWAELRTNTRRVVRKARGAGLRVREVDDLAYFYGINAKTFERQGMAPTYALDELARVDAALQRHAGRRAFVAEDALGRAHACEYLAYDDQCAISLLRGADPSLRESGASALLQWHAIEFAATVSRRFDFEGSMIRGVERYLRDFGGRQAPYFRIWRPAAERAPAARAGRSPLRDVLGRALRKAARIVDPE